MLANSLAAFCTSSQIPGDPLATATAAKFDLQSPLTWYAPQMAAHDARRIKTDLKETWGALMAAPSARNPFSTHNRSSQVMRTPSHGVRPAINNQIIDSPLPQHSLDGSIGNDPTRK
jgi:hypothetical protein